MSVLPSPLAEPAGSGTSNDRSMRRTDAHAPRPTEETPTFVPRPPSRPKRGASRIVLVPLVAGLLALVWAGDRWLVPRAAARLVVMPGDLAIDLSGPATLDATRRSSIASRLTGVVATMAVDRDDVVTPGRVIATLDAEDLRRDLDSARATGRSAREAVAVARAEEARSEAALANALANLDRQDALFVKGVTTEAARDAASATHRQAVADLARAKAAVDQAIAQAAAADAAAEQRSVKLGEAIIRAPMDGVVVSRGRWIGDTVGPGTEIVEIVDPASIVFTARLDESAIARVAPGQTATIRPAGGRVIAAEVWRVARRVDTETREFTVDLRPAALPPDWAIGRRAVATITVETRRDVLAVPIGAIDRRDGAPVVWVDVDGRAWRRAVEIGAIGGDRIEVVKGLAAGDVVLTEPRSLHPGLRVAAGDERR